VSVTVSLPASPPRPRPKLLAPRPVVLVIASPDGFLEVYGSPGVRVHVVERIDVSTSAEAKADEYLMMQLPAWVRDIYTADCFVASHTIRPRSLADEAERVLAVNLVREAAQLAKQPPQTIPAINARNLW
jgi:hypothetical protein